MVSLLIMITLGAYMATSVANLGVSDTTSTTNNLQSVQAIQIGNGGLQEALQKITNGQSPNVTNKPFGAGAYTIETDPSTQFVTVTSAVSEAKKVQKVTATFSQQAITMDVTPAALSDTNLTGIELSKSANKKAILTNMKMEWNWTTCAQNLTCTPTTGSATPLSDPTIGKTTICHYPSKNPAKKRTISVGAAALNAHLTHGDTTGICQGDPGNTTVVCENYESQNYDAQIKECAASPAGPLVKNITINGSSVANNISATNGSIIDITDTIFEANQAFTIDSITWDQNLPAQTWYAVTAYFADGSEIRKSFKFGVPSSDSITPPSQAYAVKDGTVTVNPNKTVKLDVLGSSITCGAGGAEIYVNVDLGINNAWTALFNKEDVDGGESYTTTTPGENSNFKVRARASRASCQRFNVTYDSTNLVQVKTLVNGQQAPALAGFGGQKPVLSFLQPYLNSSGKVVLATNQIIMLFELGINGNSNSAAADFQDLVVLMTIN